MVKILKNNKLNRKFSCWLSFLNKLSVICFYTCANYTIGIKSFDIVNNSYLYIYMFVSGYVNVDLI